MRSKMAADIVCEVKKAFIGRDDVARKVLLVILARGHILLEDIPGVGKTTLALAFSKALCLDYRRVQFTPDVMPSDITGFSVYNKATNSMSFKPGAVICNLFLADEINRATSRTQAALLEAMEEGQVTVDGVTHEIPQPFAVIATQNPTGSSGTQLLPDSQMDRFMARLSIGYPHPSDEIFMLKRKYEGNPLDSVNEVCSGRELLLMREETDRVYIHDEIYGYIVKLISSTREHPHVAQGASPRASVAVTKLSQASAYLNGRDYVIPADVQFVFRDGIEHRLLLSPEAKSAGMDAAKIVEQIVSSTPAPRLK